MEYENEVYDNLETIQEVINEISRLDVRNALTRMKEKRALVGLNRTVVDDWIVIGQNWNLLINQICSTKLLFF